MSLGAGSWWKNRSVDAATPTVSRGTQASGMNYREASSLLFSTLASGRGPPVRFLSPFTPMVATPPLASHTPWLGP